MTDSAAPEGVSLLLFRPTERFNRIPVDLRWQFTRRHPYYLLFWQPAQTFRSKASSDEVERALEEAASQILFAVNLSSTCRLPDPATETLDERLNAAWGSGAITPATLRTLAQILLVALPKSERMQLGRLLVESAEFEGTDKANMFPLLERLDSLQHDAWKSYPDAPIVSLNLQASQRAITEAIEPFIRELKAKYGIPEVRRNDDKLIEYLAVWDAREGWREGCYVGGNEKTLREIARQTKTPLGTLANHYKAAFEWLTGHAYAPELWIRLFGPLKFWKRAQFKSHSPVALRRPIQSRTPRPVPLSQLLPGRREYDSVDFLERAGIDRTDIDMINFVLDLQTMLARGYTAEQIQEELGTDRLIDRNILENWVTELRARDQDGL